MSEFEPCSKCRLLCNQESGCYLCYERKARTQINRGFLGYIWEEVFTYRLACFCSLSIINGVFMNHFKYTGWEIVVQAVCLGIILPGIFKDA